MYNYLSFPPELRFLTALLFPCSASDDILRADEVRTLIKDIWDMRSAKLRKSMDLMMTGGATHGKVREYNTNGMDLCAVCYLSTRFRKYTRFLVFFTLHYNYSK